MHEETRHWQEQARADFKATKDNLTSENFYVAAFLCHHALERIMKAHLIERRHQPPPQSHSLRRLASDLELPEHLQGCAAKLEPIYTDSRYPDVNIDVPAARYTREDAEGIIKITEEMFTWIQDQVMKS